MQRAISRRLMLGGAIASVACRASAAENVEFPAKQVRLIVPLGPGGGGDIVCRALADELHLIWGQTVIVENRPGGGTNTGVAALARSAPDGYTIGEINVASHAINPFLYKEKLPFDPIKDFVPLSKSVYSGLSPVIINTEKIPVSTVPELVAFMKANPKKVAYGTQGVGTSQHICGALMQKITNTEMTHVPYNNPGVIITDLLGGRIDLIPDLAGNYWSAVDDKKVKALAVCTPARSEFAPELPALNEFYPGLEITSWRGIAAPANTPQPIVDRLSSGLRQALNEPRLKEKLKKLYFVTQPQTPEEFSQFMDDERKRLGPIVIMSGATAG